MAPLHPAGELDRPQDIGRAHRGAVLGDDLAAVPVIGRQAGHRVGREGAAAGIHDAIRATKTRDQATSGHAMRTPCVMDYFAVQ